MDISALDGHYNPVEVETAHFRGVAQNFYNLPIHILLDLKLAQFEGKGDEILVLFDAAELAFDAKQFDKPQDLSFRQFMEVIRQWVDKSQPQE